MHIKLNSKTNTWLKIQRHLQRKKKRQSDVALIVNALVIFPDINQKQRFVLSVYINQVGNRPVVND